MTPVSASETEPEAAPLLFFMGAEQLFTRLNRDGSVPAIPGRNFSRQAARR